MVNDKTLRIVYNMVQEIGVEATAKERGVSTKTILDYLKRFKSKNLDAEIIEENVKIKKQVQKFQDTNRIERKAFREYARVENAVSEQNKEFIKLLERESFNTFSPSPIELKDINEVDGYGIIQLSDWHLNELVNLPNNKYDIMVASKRAKRFIESAIFDFVSKGIKHVLVAFTGDQINSDRRLDEKLNMATNRVRAQFLAVELFKQMLEHLSLYFTVHVASVSGNESRVNKDWEWSEACVTDNYDYSIHNILRLLFKNADRIHFCGDCEVEKVVSFGGKNILLMHGNQLGKNYDVSISKVKARYSAQNIKIDFLIFGHLHETRICGLYARSGSPVGANAYSENGLQLSSISSQNIYFIQEDGIDGRQVILQDTEGYEPYNIHEELMMYNAKSASKLSNTKTVFQVVI